MMWFHITGTMVGGFPLQMPPNGLQFLKGRSGALPAWISGLESKTVKQYQSQDLEDTVIQLQYLCQVRKVFPSQAIAHEGRDRYFLAAIMFVKLLSIRIPVS